MELRKFLSAIWGFLTLPVSPLPLGIYRCFFGLLALASGTFLGPDILTWFGANGIFSPTLAAQSIGVERLDLFAWFGSSNVMVISIFATFMMSAVLTALGLFSRLAAVMLFITITSLHHRNIYILHSGDTIIRLMSFFLMLAPSGAAFSIDRIWRVYQGRESPNHLIGIPPTAFRLMQIQLCLIYFSTGFWKATGGMWMDGTAVFVVNQIGQFERFPIPSLMRTLWFSKMMSWYTLGVELGAPFLLWFKETRLFMLAGLIALHAGLEYTMNIQLFQPIVVSIFVLFLTEAEILDAWTWIGRRLTSKGIAAVHLTYGAHNLSTLRWVHVLQCLDVLNLLVFTPTDVPFVNVQIVHAGSQVALEGVASIRALALRLPLVFPFGLLTLLPGASSLGNLTLRFIASRGGAIAVPLPKATSQSKPLSDITKKVS